MNPCWQDARVSRAGMMVVVLAASCAAPADRASDRVPHGGASGVDAPRAAPGSAAPRDPRRFALHHDPNKPQSYREDGSTIIDLRDLTEASLPEPAFFGSSQYDWFGNLLVYDRVGTLVAFDPIERRIVWEVAAGDGYATHVVADEGGVVWASESEVARFSSRGERVWKHRLPGAPAQVVDVLSANAGVAVANADGNLSWFTDDATSVELSVPQAPAGRVRVDALYSRPDGLCASFFATGNARRAFRCYDTKGAVQWSRDWDLNPSDTRTVDRSLELAITRARTAHVLITSTEQDPYGQKASRLVRWSDGRVVSSNDHTFADFLEDVRGEIAATVQLSGDKVRLVERTDPDGTERERWAVDWGQGPVRGIRVEPMPTGLLMLFETLAYPNRASCCSVTLVDAATGATRWRMSEPTVRADLEHLEVRSFGDKLVLESSDRSRKPALVVLSAQTGAVLFPPPE